MQFHQNRMIGTLVSEKEKVLVRVIYRTLGCVVCCSELVGGHSVCGAARGGSGDREGRGVWAGGECEECEQHLLARLGSRDRDQPGTPRAEQPHQLLSSR